MRARRYGDDVGKRALWGLSGEVSRCAGEDREGQSVPASLAPSSAAALPGHREARSGRHGRGVPRRERGPRGLQEEGRHQARLAAPVGEEAFISMFLDEARLGRTSRTRTASRCSTSASATTPTSSSWSTSTARPQGRHRVDAQAGPLVPAGTRSTCARRSARGSPTPTSSRTRRASPSASSTATCRRPTCSSPSYGEIKIVDFGLAKASSQLEKSEPGIIKGKFSYLSPEAAWARRSTSAPTSSPSASSSGRCSRGRKLFQGETDFETVKQVQDAVIPSISQINREGAPRARAHRQQGARAKTSAQRYQTARELGQDLTRFLFAYGRPVSTFDIAEIVTARHPRSREGPRASGLEDRQAHRGGALRVHLPPRQLVRRPHQLGERAQPRRRSCRAPRRRIADSLPNIADGNLSALEDADIPEAPSQAKIVPHASNRGVPQVMGQQGPRPVSMPPPAQLMAAQVAPVSGAGLRTYTPNRPQKGWSRWGRDRASS
jgi:hypothetical protein